MISGEGQNKIMRIASNYCIFEDGVFQPFIILTSWTPSTKMSCTRPDQTRPLSSSKGEIEAKGDYDADQNEDEDDDYMMMMTTTCIKMQQ